MKVMIKWWVILGIYAVINGMAVLLPFIPGPATFFFWGVIAPRGMVIVWWGYASKRRGEMANWWVIGVLSTMAYLSLGGASFWVVAQIWAAV